MLRIFLFITLFWSSSLWAFPELVRYGYTQCTACHVSPTGGGILNKYGRELSAEVLSTWSYENENQFLHSKVGKDLMEKGILVGGDVRGIDTYMKAPGVEQSKAFLMMADLSGAYQTGNFTGVISIGEINTPGNGGIQGDVHATEYYGLMKFTDEIGVRAGRFLPAYGINFPDHTVVTREMLGFVPRFQFDTVEASYLSENWTILATMAKSTSAVRAVRQERLGTVNVAYAVAEGMRVGASYWAGDQKNGGRSMKDVNAILGFTKKFYNMTEANLEFQNSKQGLYGLTQFGYEAYKGVTPYLQYQREQTDLSSSPTLTSIYGVGCHFYPRPHLELSGEWDHTYTSVWSDEAYLMAHYYF